MRTTPFTRPVLVQSLTTAAKTAACFFALLLLFSVIFLPSHFTVATLAIYAIGSGLVLLATAALQLADRRRGQ